MSTNESSVKNLKFLSEERPKIKDLSYSYPYTSQAKIEKFDSKIDYKLQSIIATNTSKKDSVFYKPNLCSYFSMSKKQLETNIANLDFLNLKDYETNFIK